MRASAVDSTLNFPASMAGQAEEGSVVCSGPFW